MRIAPTLPIAALLLGSLFGCARFHEQGPRPWLVDFHPTNPQLSAVSRHQVAVVSKTGEGLGVPLSPTRIATVAHVVDDLSLGEYLSIRYPPSLGGRPIVYSARLVHIAPETEVAILEVLGSGVPETAVPEFCPKSIGGDKALAVRPIFNGGQVTAYQQVFGYIANHHHFPLPTTRADATARRTGYSPRAMEGQERVVALSISDAGPGNSGGALYDIDRECVLGLVSMAAHLGDFESADQTRYDLGLLEGDWDPQLIFAIPVTAFTSPKIGR